MKHLIFITSLAALIVWNLACTKESIDQQQKDDCIEKTVILEEGARNGANPIWFKTSNSIDNALTGSVREHIFFNQAKVQYQKFTPTGDDAFSHLGVFYYPYWMEIVFNNDSIGVYKVSVGYVNGQGFTHHPNILDNTMTNNHQARMLSYKAVGKTIKYTNGKRDQPINLRLFEMSYDGVPIEIQANTPMTKSSNIADYGHKN